MRDSVWREGERMSGRDALLLRGRRQGRKVYLQRGNVRECTVWQSVTLPHRDV